MQKYKSNPAKTVLTISMGMLVLYFFTKWQWPLWLSFGIGLIGLLSTFLSEKIEWLWMKLAWLLSLLIPKILLSIIFYLLLFPIALISKIFKKTDPLMLKNNSTSTFTTVNKKFSKENFEKIW